MACVHKTGYRTMPKAHCALPGVQRAQRWLVRVLGEEPRSPQPVRRDDGGRGGRGAVLRGGQHALVALACEHRHGAGVQWGDADAATRRGGGRAWNGAGRRRQGSGGGGKGENGRAW